MPQYDVDLREYWRILKKWKFIVIITTFVIGLFSVVFAILRAPEPIYRAECIVKIEKQPVKDVYGRPLAWSMEEDLETQVSMIMGFPLMKRVAERLKLIPKIESEDETQLESHIVALVNSLQAKVQAEPDQFAKIIRIRITDHDPVFAQNLANAIAITFKEMHYEEQGKRIVETLRYIKQQLKTVREKLRLAEDEFNSFIQKNQLVSIDLQSEDLLVRKRNLKDRIKELENAKADLQILSKRIRDFLKNPSGPGNNLYSNYVNKQYQRLYDSFLSKVLKRDSLLEDYTERHPEVIDIKRKIVEDAKKLLFIVDQQIKDYSNLIQELKKQVLEVDKKLNDLMNIKLRYERLKRKVDSLNDMIALLERKNQEALIRKAERPDEVTIVQPAFLPKHPINPPRKIATGTLGMIVGLVLGIVLAFILETFDTSIGAIEDVETTLGAKVLGVIPFTDIKSIKAAVADIKKGSDFKENMYLAAHFAPRSVLSESLRALRVSIELQKNEREIKSALVTSASPKEGKSFICTNLAITMAQGGMKTLLIEADLRKPIIWKIFGLDMSPGLADSIMGDYSWKDTVRTVTDLIVGKMSLEDVMLTSGLDNLHIITSGTIPPNPVDLFNSKRFKSFLEEIRKEFDFIVFDSPPILSSSEPTILSGNADITLLVYKVGSISRGLLKRAKMQLSQSNPDLIGVILNGVKAEVSPDFQDFKYYKRYYESKEEKEKKRYWFPLIKKDLLKGLRFQKDKTKLKTKFILILLSFFLIFVSTVYQNGLFKRFRPIPEYKQKTEKGGFVKKEKIDATLLPTNNKSNSSQKPITKEEELNLRPYYPYSIKIGSFKDFNKAKKIINNLKKAGVPVYWIKVNLGEKGKWIRVFAGYFRYKKGAEKYIDDLNIKDAQILKTPYSISISNKDFKKVDEDFSLYTLNYSPTLTYNYIGAFSKKEEAEKILRSLRERGIEGKVVLR